MKIMTLRVGFGLEKWLKKYVQNDLKKSIFWPKSVPSSHKEVVLINIRIIEQ